MGDLGIGPSPHSPAPRRFWGGFGESPGSLLRHPHGMDMLARIEQEITALRESGALTAAFRGSKEQGEGLRSFGDSETLIAFLRDSEAGPRRRKDAALAALCVEASSGDQQVATLLVWLLLPGLLRVRSGLAGRDALEAQDLDAELIAGMWEAATEVRPQTRNVAARLVNGARWRALAAIREAIDWERRSEPLDRQAAELPEPKVGTFGSLGILTQAVREGVITEGEVELILVSRQTIRDVGRLGVTLCAARQRKHRARLRLVDWLAQSSPIPPRFLAPSPPRNLPENSQGSPVTIRPSLPPL
jgi:hypothetical protein